MTKDLNTMVDESEGDYEHFNIIADPGQAVLRVDKFLLDKLPHISRNKIALAAKNGNVLVNGERVKQNYKVKPEDEISMVFSHPKREFEMLAEDIPINIVYEDDAVIIINKPADFVVHPGTKLVLLDWGKF